MCISTFVSLLVESPPCNGVFNPWADVDKENDIGAISPQLRRNQLTHYLQSRLDSAKYLIIGEAVGYQGGHFSGIAMTSERILLGFQRKRGIHPAHVLQNLDPQRTSRPEKMPRGFTEPTATIVWETLLKFNLKSTEFVLWNAFPWHPFDPKKGMLSNRKPKSEEMAKASHILNEFLLLFPGITVIAMGKVASESLTNLKTDCYPVRHPAQGGAKAFRDQILGFLKKMVPQA